MTEAEAAPFAVLPDALPEAVRPYVARLGYLLLKPDCVLRGAVQPVLDRVEAAGFEFLDHDLIAYVEPEYVRLFYGTTFDSAHDVWDVNCRVFELGPSIAVVLLLDPESGGDAVRRLKELKGPIMPTTGAGTIREELGVSNRVLNLLHTPDTRESSLGELRAIFGLPRLLRILDDAASDEERRDKRLRVSAYEIADLVECHDYTRRSFSGWRNVQRLKLRILFRIARAAAAEAVSTEARDVVDRLHDLFHRTLDDLDEPSPGEEAAVAVARAAEEEALRTRLGELLGGPEPRGRTERAILDSDEFAGAVRLLFDVLRDLSEPDRFPSLAFGPLWHVLRAAQVYANSFEQYLVESTLVYFPGPRPSGAGGS